MNSVMTTLQIIQTIKHLSKNLTQEDAKKLLPALRRLRRKMRRQEKARG